MSAGERLVVELGERAYGIEVGRGLAGPIRERVEADRAAGRPAAVIADAAVVAAQGSFMEAAFGPLPVHAVGSGEGSKCFGELERCCGFLAEAGVDRSGCVYAVGGGVVGDLAGFAAASWLRGVGFVQVPTTLLAMVDSSVGGKTGINIAAGKNLVGAFHQPEAVWADVDRLRTLPEREFSAGMAEIIKHGLLADEALFEELEHGERLRSDSAALAGVIQRNCAIKAGVVSADEREERGSGGRALLNLGHTFGHAIEAVAGYGCYVHGEAVAIGLVLAARLSEIRGSVEAGTAGRVCRVLERYGLPVRLREPLVVEDLLAAAARDKKARRGRLRYVVLESVGKAVVADDVAEPVVRGLWLEAGAVER